MTTTTDTTTWADVPAPAGAARVFKPSQDATGRIVRPFLTFTTTVGDAQIDIVGEQRRDGTISSHGLFLYTDGDAGAGLDADHARELAAALIVAADALTGASSTVTA